MSSNSAAHNLLGLTVGNGWKVIAKHVRADGASGGRYSVCYYVERNGERAFLKAIDFSRAEKAEDFAREMQKLTEAFNFERDLLNKCSQRHMDRVVTPLENGVVKVDDTFLGRQVHYIIFEAADGDIRGRLAAIDMAEVTWRLYALRHITTGLSQLHTAGIAHQDMKPSNVVTFGEESKVADLGRASEKGVVGPTDDERFPGDRTYAAPELLYNHIAPDFSTRRFGGDLYLLGSMVTFFFTGISSTAALLSHLHPDHHYLNWQGSYKDVLPYLRNAFGSAVRSIGSQFRIRQLQIELTDVIAQLCDPDPELRGHPLSRIGIGNRFSLERYISKFDHLALRSRLGKLER
jgi:eukaryotic-like serine/threonine-protein kinase